MAAFEVCREFRHLVDGVCWCLLVQECGGSRSACKRWQIAVSFTLRYVFHCTNARALTGRVGLYRHTSSNSIKAGWQNCLVRHFLQCLPDPIRSSYSSGQVLLALRFAALQCMQHVIQEPHCSLNHGHLRILPLLRLALTQPLHELGQA